MSAQTPTNPQTTQNRPQRSHAQPQTPKRLTAAELRAWLENAHPDSTIWCYADHEVEGITALHERHAIEITVCPR